MSLLTELSVPPRASRSVAPHRFRLVGGRVRVATAAGERATLSLTDYRRFLSGALKLAESPLPSPAALSAWRGPSLFVVELSREGEAASLETAQAAVDLAFSTPAPATRLELTGADDPAAWPAVWLSVELAQRRAEWSKRALEIRVRLEGELPEDRADFLRRRGIRTTRAAGVDGAPRPLPRADYFRLDVTPRARAAKEWVAALRAAGCSAARLDFASTKIARGFYADFVAAALADGGLVEEWSAALLSGRRWLLPGYDVLSELFVSARGEVFASEAAAGSESGGQALRLGEVSSLRWDSLSEDAVARACLAAAAAQSQPVCLQCVYGELCAVAPSVNLAEQGTLWGRTPSSAACAGQMARLDELFGLLENVEAARGLREWASAA